LLNVLFTYSQKGAYNVIIAASYKGRKRMPYELPLPAALTPWKVKILDNELLFEEPHVTIRFKTTHWRVSLRSGMFLDENPNPSDVSPAVVAAVQSKLEILRKEWDERFPTNPVAPLEGEE
jgi:hypothetical protein